MENNLIVYSTKENKKATKRVRMGFMLKRSIAWTLIICMCAYIAVNFDKLAIIKDFFTDLFSENQVIDTPNDSNAPPSDFPSEGNQDNNGTLNENTPSTIPQGAHQIIDNHFVFEEITNKTGISVAPNEDYILPTTTEIYQKYGGESPCVLITHSSVLECYSNGIYYNTTDDFYNSKENVGQIGKIICEELNRCNVNAIHIDEIYANGGIYKSKDEYEATLKKVLEAYPSIAYVFNISRDMLINDDLTMNKGCTVKDNQKIAQIKLTVGTAGDTDSYWQKNLDFSYDLAKSNSDLIYNLTISPFDYSQRVSPVCINIDIGSYSNSFFEAKLCAKEFSRIICEKLKQG